MAVPLLGSLFFAPPHAYKHVAPLVLKTGGAVQDRVNILFRHLRRTPTNTESPRLLKISTTELPDEIVRLSEAMNTRRKTIWFCHPSNFH